MARALDLTGHSAAYATRLLAEAGHDVIRVEPRQGDALRRQGPFLGNKPGLESGAFHQFLNTGKRSFTPNLESSSGRQALLELAAASQVVIATVPLPIKQDDLLAA